MAGLNKWLGAGNLVANAVVRYTQTNQPVTSMRIACNERYFANNKQQERVEYVNLVIWGKRGPAMVSAGYLNKGQGLIIEGRLQTRSYQHKTHTDVKMYVTEVVVGNHDGALQLIDRRGGQTGDSMDNIPPPSDEDLASLPEPTEDTQPKENTPNVVDTDDFAG